MNNYTKLIFKALIGLLILIIVFYYLLSLFVICPSDFPLNFSTIYCDDKAPVSKEQMSSYLDYISLTFSVDHLTEEEDKQAILETAWNSGARTFYELKLHIIDHLVKKTRQHFLGFTVSEFEVFVKRYYLLFDEEFKNITTVRRVAAYIYYKQGTPY